MYNVYNKSDVYFKYNLSDDKLTLIGNRNDFLKEIYLMSKNEKMGPKDKPITERTSILRNVLYLDGYYNTVDPKNYLEEAFILFDKKVSRFNHCSYSNFGKDNYKFRSGPVSHTGSKRGVGHHTKKCRGMKRIHVMVSDVEYGKYIRNKAIPFNEHQWDDAYDGVSSRKHKSWKSQKKRKQWM